MPTTPRTRREDIESLPRAVFADPVYFSKFSVKLGTRFRSYGRTSWGTTWEVVSITTTTSGSHGRVRHDIAYVRSLDDILRLHCIATGEWRTLRFGYMSETARWRLDE